MITDITRSKKLYPRYLPTNKTTSINKKLTMRYVSFDIVELVFSFLQFKSYWHRKRHSHSFSINITGNKFGQYRYYSFCLNFKNRVGTSSPDSHNGAIFINYKPYKNSSLNTCFLSKLRISKILINMGLDFSLGTTSQLLGIWLASWINRRSLH